MIRETERHLQAEREVMLREKGSSVGDVISGKPLTHSCYSRTVSLNPLMFVAFIKSLKGDL